MLRFDYSFNLYYCLFLRELDLNFGPCCLDRLIDFHIVELFFSIIMFRIDNLKIVLIFPINVGFSDVAVIIRSDLYQLVHFS